MSDHVLCYNCFQNRPAGPGPCPLCGFDPAVSRKKFPLALPGGSILAGRYLIGRPLGQGGFGITYTARDLNARETVAVKEFFPEGIALRQSGDTQVSTTGAQQASSFAYGMGKFLEEAETLSRFNGHPNIVGVRQYFEENGTAYFSMEYLEGGSLKEYLAGRGGRLGWEEAMALLDPVFGALETVHQVKIVHRDISPDNIYLCRDGSVKLLDFGAARYSLEDRSQSLSVILKMGYAPVEQYARHGRQGPWTDVYALAATLYRCVTGGMPPESVDRVRQDTLVPPSERGVDIPPQAEAALLRGLAVEAKDRWQSAAEFRQGLLGQIPVPPSPQELRRQAQRQAEEQARRRQEEQERRERERQEREARLREQVDGLKKRRRRRVLAGVLGGLVLVFGVLGGLLGRQAYQWQQEKVYPFRVLTYADGDLRVEGKRAALRRLEAVTGALESGANQPNGGRMTLRGGFVLTDPLLKAIQVYNGCCYYQDGLGTVYAADGRQRTEVLPAEVRSLLSPFLVGEHGILYQKTEDLLQGTGGIWLAAWTGDRTVGEPRKLVDCCITDPLCLENGQLFYTTAQASGIWRYDLATGETVKLADELLFPGFVMDGWLYGWAFREEGKLLWRMDTEGGGYTELYESPAGFSALNGLGGQVYASIGQSLLRIDGESGRAETVYTAPAGVEIWTVDLSDVGTGVLIAMELRQGDAYTGILLDPAGQQYDREELLGM